MAGSKGGKHLKGKGKSQLKYAADKRPETFKYGLDLAQTSENYYDGPNSYRDQNSPLCPLTTSMSRFTEEEMEELMHTNLQELYAEPKVCRLDSGNSEREIDKAMLENEHIRGRNHFLDNIVENSIAYLEKINVPEKGFNVMSEVYKTALETMVGFIMHSEPSMARSNAIRHLVSKKWGYVPSMTMISHSHSRVEDDGSPSSSFYEKFPSKDENPSWKKIFVFERINKLPALRSRLKRSVPILAAHMILQSSNTSEHILPSCHGKVTEASEEMDPDFSEYITHPSFEEFLNRLLENAYAPKFASIFDVVKSIRNLQDEVKRNKEWAQQKVILAAKTLSKHLLEMNMLRMEADKKKKGNEINSIAKSCIVKLIKMEESLSFSENEANNSTERVITAEVENAQIKADFEASKLSLASLESDVKDILERERKWLKKGKELEEQCRLLQAQCHDVKQRVLHLQLELLQVEKNIKETEIQWRQDMKEKYQMLTCLSQEIRTAETQNVDSREELSRLRQKLEIDSQIAEDECGRLKNELNCLCLSSCMGDMSLLDNNLLYESLEAVPTTSSAPFESSQVTLNHRNCMICLRDEVSVIFLPCGHEVVCYHCKLVEEQCPYCHVEIEQSIRVYSPTS